MGIWDGIQLFSVAVVVMSFVYFIWVNFNQLQQIAVNSETYTSIIHHHIVNALEASQTKDPIFALTKVCEAQVTINTLIKLVGGEVILNKMTGFDLGNILNVLTLQERIIRSALPFDPNNLLSKEVMEKRVK